MPSPCMGSRIRRLTCAEPCSVSALIRCSRGWLEPAPDRRKAATVATVAASSMVPPTGIESRSHGISGHLATLWALRKVEAKGILSTAEDLQQTAGQVFRYGVPSSRCERHIAADWKAASSNRDHPAERHEAIQGGQDQWQATPDPTGDPGRRNLAGTEPSDRRGQYVFAGARTTQRPMSENTLNSAPRRLGWCCSRLRSGGRPGFADPVTKSTPGLPIIRTR